MITLVMFVPHFVQTVSLFAEKMPFKYLPIISLYDILVPVVINSKGRSISPNQSNIYTILRSNRFDVFFLKLRTHETTDIKDAERK